MATGRAARIEPLAVLPVFFKLAGRTVLLAGGDEPAVWKAELLAAAGAEVRVVAADPCPAMRELALAPPAGSVTLVERPWATADLAGVALAIGAIEDEEEALNFQTAAHAAGVPVNVVDKPAACDFQFGTVVARSPLVIGISTDGAAPVLGQAIRTRLEALLPQSLRDWAVAAKLWREDVQARALDFRRRRRFWERFAALAMAAEAAPTAEDKADCFAAIDASNPKGQLTLVGGADGHVASVTLGAVAALQSADIIIVDPEVPTALRNLARREAERVAGDLPPGDLMDVVRTAIDEGRHIAWLGLGYPASCVRWRDRRAKLSSLMDAPRLIPDRSGACPCCPDP